MDSIKYNNTHIMAIILGILVHPSITTIMVIKECRDSNIIRNMQLSDDLLKKWVGPRAQVAKGLY